MKELIDVSDAALLHRIRLKFESGNDVPVPEVRVTRAEWDAVERIMDARLGVAIELASGSTVDSSPAEASDDEMIDSLLKTQIPGGSQAKDWFLPHDNPRALANVRDVVRRMIGAAGKHFSHDRRHKQSAN